MTNNFVQFIIIFPLDRNLLRNSGNAKNIPITIGYTNTTNMCKGERWTSCMAIKFSWLEVLSM